MFTIASRGGKCENFVQARVSEQFYHFWFVYLIQLKLLPLSKALHSEKTSIMKLFMKSNAEQREYCDQYGLGQIVWREELRRNIKFIINTNSLRHFSGRSFTCRIIDSSRDKRWTYFLLWFDVEDEDRKDCLRDLYICASIMIAESMTALIWES